MKAHGFRVSFTPLVGVLPTFPSRYLSTIGLEGVFSLAGWSRRVRAGFHVPRATQGSATRRGASRMGLSPAAAGLSSPSRSPPKPRRRGPTTPAARRHAAGLGCSPFARHYWGNHCCFLFLRVLRCFSSPRSPHGQAVMAALQAAGLSHSEIRGSQAVCAYPRLFAAYHVLHRLREPRHPPCALALFFSLPRRKRARKRGARRRVA